MTFSVTQGSGAIIGTNPVVTSGGGYASVIAKLGTAAGGNNNQFRATIGALTADFTATATPGPQHHLTWTTQPAILFQNSSFGVQPVVELRDEFENPIDASGTVTITVDTGTGAVAGTNPVNLENGVATFTDLEYSAAEGGVILQASNGAVSGNSSALTVGAAPPGACKINDATFITADGGCKDISTGLIWSSLGPYINDWYRVVWDSLKTGALIPDVDDYGRGSDYSEDLTDTPCGSYCDDDSNAQSDVISYCKSLNEGGRTDWRMPTKAELQYVGANGANNHLAGNKTLYYWSSSSVGNGYAYAVRLSDGDLSTRRKYDGYPGGAYQVCVRGGTRVASSKLVIANGSISLAGAGITGSIIKVQIQDSSGNNVNAGGKTLTLNSTDLGTLGGVLTAQTDAYGLATFDAFTLDTAGSATITFTAPGFTSVDHVMEVRAGLTGDQHICSAESSRFRTQNGGCHDTINNLVWSKITTGTLTWNQVAWDSALAGNDAPDGDEGARTNDRDPSSAGAAIDTSLVDYCHDLEEGGFTDWRMPTSFECLDAAVNSGPYHHFEHNFREKHFWNGYTTSSGGGTYAYRFGFLDSGSGYYQGNTVKANLYYGVCVRDP